MIIILLGLLLLIRAESPEPRRTTVELTELRVFLTVAAERSFSRAAMKLHRTQPAISQAVRRLEEEIGEKLFDRSSKDGTLTQEGQVLLEYARQMLNLRHTAQNAIREVRDLHTGKVTISANEHTVFSLLPVITEFIKRHPLVKVEVRRGVASRIPKEIAARDVELGVISFQPSDNTLKSVPVMTDELLLIVSPGHKLASRSSVSIRELGDETFIAHNAHSPYRDKVIETFAKHRTKLNITIELPSLEAIKRLVEAGSGVALVPRLAAAAEVAEGRLCGLSVTEMKLERKLNIVYRKNSTLSYAAKAFLDIARETAA
jgi:DNA-binding transcriptional LysR family regulator